MKYAAIDIETTGLDRDQDQILQVAIVVEDTERVGSDGIPDILALPTFEGVIRHERISGHPFALAMNADLIEVIAKAPRGPNAEVELRGRTVRIFDNSDELASGAIDFLDATIDTLNGPPYRRDYVAAGKNAAGFDLPFLPGKLRVCFHHRVIDVGSVALGVEASSWREDRIPGLSELLSVISNREATHDALEDARDVVRLLRWLTGNYRGGAKA